MSDGFTVKCEVCNFTESPPNFHAIFHRRIVGTKALMVYIVCPKCGQHQFYQHYYGELSEQEAILMSGSHLLSTDKTISDKEATEIADKKVKEYKFIPLKEVLSIWLKDVLDQELTEKPQS